ncbi:MAG: hypothetical protein MI923_13890 [Phycisphaerales bacterium]|nr:hypothetical protein [Phycisphaerales bacterium]
MNARNKKDHGTQMPKHKWLLSGFGLLASIAVIGTFLIPIQEEAEACRRTTPPKDCDKSVNLVKAFPFAIFPGGGGAVFIPVRVNTKSGAVPPSNNCPSPSTVTGGMVSVTLNCPGGPLFGNTPLPPRLSGFRTGFVFVPVVIPGGFRGKCAVTASVQANFSADSCVGPVTATAVGDTVLCLVEESPDIPNVPRLDMVVDSSGTPLCGAGVQTKSTITLINNDLNHSVSLMFEADATQRARMPSSPGGESDGVYSISTPNLGDDFAIAFEEDCPANGILPLSSDPTTFIQRTISKPIVIPPDDFAVVVIVSNSYLMCEEGSCAEKTYVVEGQFANGDPVVACAGDSITLMPGGDCPQAQFVNACCMGDGSCQALLPSDCANMGGTPLAALTECQGDGDMNGSDDSCDDPDSAAPTLACCFGDGSCQDMIPIDCSNAGGTPQGLGETCVTATCPMLGACCFPNSTCQTLFDAICASAGGVFQGNGTICGGPSIDIFVDVLLGTETDQFRIVASDKNSDAKADGADIEPLIQEFLTGGVVVCP